MVEVPVTRVILPATASTADAAAVGHTATTPISLVFCTATASLKEQDGKGKRLYVLVISNAAPDVQCRREPLGLPADLHVLFRRTQFLIAPMTMPIIVICYGDKLRR